MTEALVTFKNRATADLVNFSWSSAHVISLLRLVEKRLLLMKSGLRLNGIIPPFQANMPTETVAPVPLPKDKRPQHQMKVQSKLLPKPTTPQTLSLWSPKQLPNESSKRQDSTGSIMYYCSCIK